MSQTVWITGVSKGLGKVLAEGFAAHGWQVAGCARSQQQLEDLEMNLGGDHYFQSADVSSEHSVQQWIAAASAMTGTPDLLINNAAIINSPKPLWEVSEEEFEQVMQVNICGVARMIRNVLPLMMEQGSGIIANLSSGWGRSTSPDVAPYCASKWAIEGMTQALSQELPKGIAAIAVNPGVIDTDMLRQTWKEGAEGFPKADEWCERALPFFAALSHGQNGQSLTVN